MAKGIKVGERQVLHRASSQGVLIGKVEAMRDPETGDTWDVQFWYNYSAPDCPLVRQTIANAVAGPVSA